MMREAAAPRPRVHAFEARDMFVRDGAVHARARRLDASARQRRTGTASPASRTMTALGDFDCVLMRKDPPFDQEYYYATLLLERAEAEGARVVNSPRGAARLEREARDPALPHFAPPTLVARDMRRVQAFIDAHGDVIVKKLDGMGGTMIFRVGADDPEPQRDRRDHRPTWARARSWRSASSPRSRRATSACW